MSKRQVTLGNKPIRGYTANALNAREDVLAPPSINVLIDENGNVAQRLGYLVEDIDLGETGKPATCLYVKEYDVTVFCLGTKVKYYDWTTRTVYDTGLSLTDGTTTRMDLFEGDVYLTNTTDGLRRLIFGRLNDSAPDLGDSTFTVDSDFAARLSVFSITSGTIRIQGTSEAFSSLVVATGVVTHSTSLSQSYSDNAVCVVTSDISSGLEKASKPFVWKRRLGLLGSLVAGNSDRPNNTLYYGKFAGPTNLEDFILFPYNAGGSTRELVGNYGRVTNAVPVKDYLYQFTEEEAYVTAAGDVPTSGDAIGRTTPDIRDENNGCLNEDSAVSLGNNEIAYITSNKRIMRIRISTESGAPVAFADESFDVPMREILKDMDADQTGALAFYHKGKRRAIFQVSIRGQWYWLVYDNGITWTDDAGNVHRGLWQPPQLVLAACNFFERNGVLFCTDAFDDTVYSLNTSFDDNGTQIDSILAFANFPIGNGEVLTFEAEGTVSQPAIIRTKIYVTNNRLGRRSGSEKLVRGSNYTYGEDHSVGADSVGEGNAEAEVSPVAEWSQNFDVFPSEGHHVQPIITQSEGGGYYSLSRYAITIRTSSLPLPSAA